jgi:diguanylate cyclase (GGDEF)-like protein
VILGKLALLVEKMRALKTLGNYLGCLLLTGLIFCIDLKFPLGISFGSLYIVAVLFAFWSPRPRFVLVVAAVSSLLVIAALACKPSVEEMWRVVFNRGLALFIIWVTALLCLKIKTAEQELIRVASHDFLTGLLNRREIFNRLHTEICRVDRIDKPFSVIMLDIDHFKRVNDTYGHHAGDQLLRETAQILKGHLREYDYICRYGGEEFLVVAPETTLPVARELAERLRRVMMEARFRLPALPVMAITISAGVAQQMKGEAIGTLISRADDALYQAKQSGRNRVKVSENT